jgi:hypothetical protein
MKYILGLMLAPLLLSAQMKEDLLDDIDMKTIFVQENSTDIDDLISPDDHYAHYYAKYKVAEISRLMKETKSTSIYIYHKGQLDAYQDIIYYFEAL